MAQFPGADWGSSSESGSYFQGINFTQFGLNDLNNTDNTDCPKCPKKAKDGEMYSIGFTGYQFRDGNWVELEPGKSITYKGKSYFNPSVEPITGDVPIGLSGEKAIYSVYQGLEGGVVKYVGITKRAPLLRWAEHMSAGEAKSLLRYEVVEGATQLTRTQARIWEQTLINRYRLQKYGGELLNKINSISRQYWLKYGIKP